MEPSAPARPTAFGTDTRNARRATRCIGRYQVTKLLGEGSMGRVYLATDPELGREVAVKVLRLESAGSSRESYIARFRNEARAAARFNHPNVVSVYDAGEDPSLGPFVVYELIDGESLRPRIDKGPVEPNTVVKIARGVAAALDALHAVGIVHRDVKPDNILLGTVGQVKITDLGIARIPDATLTREGQFLGTPAYAAPEAISRGEYSHRADVFSLTAVIFEALTGTRPFPGDEAVAVSYSVVNDATPSATALCPSLPVAVDAVLARGLSKRASDRQVSARALVEELAVALRTPRPSRIPQKKSLASARDPRFGFARKLAPYALAGLLTVAALGAFAQWRLSGPEASTHEAPSDAPARARLSPEESLMHPRAQRARAARPALTTGAGGAQPRRP